MTDESLIPESLIHFLLMALVPDGAGALSFHDVWLLRKNHNYVAISCRFSDDVAFAWLNQPVESLVCTRGRRSGAFLPPEDARLIRHRVGQGYLFLVCEQDAIASHLQDCLPRIKWEEAVFRITNHNIDIDMLQSFEQRQ